MKFNGCDATQPTAISGKVFTDRGTGVRIKPEDFMAIISKSEDPLVVETAEGFFTKIYKYATAYKGFVFFTESLNRLQFTAHTEIIQAQSISSDI
ncbi:MAG: hypothetical protein AAF915_00435 [Cyanobacteria bacterium P01_D01_bin.50]